MLFVEAKSRGLRQMGSRARLSTHRAQRTELISVPWLKATALVLGLLTLVGLILLLGRWGYDDPYITFRYAHNLLAGHGLVYNPGQRILSTTAPMYAILLAGLGLAWSDMPALSNLVSIISLALAAAVLFRQAQSRGEPVVGMLAALLLSLSPRLLMSIGSETCLFVLLTLFAFWAFDRSRLNLAAIALAVSAMVRPDGLLAAMVLFTYHLIRRRSMPWRPFILYTAITGGWFAGLWLYYGSPLPVTLLAKQQQGQMANSILFGAGLLEILHEYSRQPAYWLYGILAIVGLARVAKEKHHWLPLLVWTALYVLAYTLLGVSRYFWYYAPLVPAVAVLVAEGMGALLRALVRLKPSQSLAALAIGGLLAVLLIPLVTGVLWMDWHIDPRLEVYQEIGEWIEANTPVQASVGALEVGIVGYYSQRPMIGFAGLLQPDIGSQLSAAGTYHDSTSWALKTYTPDYVVLRPDRFSAVVQSEWFQATYTPLQDFSNTRTLWLTLYQRSPAP